MKLTISIKNTALKLKKSLRRFPTAIIFSSAAAVLGIILNHADINMSIERSEMLTRIVMVLALGAPVSASIRLIFERIQNHKKSIEITAYIFGAMLLGLYYNFFLKDLSTISGSRYAAVSIATYLIFVFIPYLYKRDNFELYVIRLISRFITTFIYSLVIYGGISAILFTIDRLLGVSVKGELYLDMWIIIIGVFLPAYFLSGVPEYKDELDISGYPKALGILLKYIIIPLISAYLIILYIYFGKIIITRQWPVGLVAHLVLWYSVICVGVIFFIYQLRSQGTKIEKFIFWLTRLILPILIMMFVSIFIRIRAYGVTENRYYVVILGAWVMGIMLFMCFSKHLRNIVIPISLSIVTIVSVFGPLSSFSVSKYSQNKRLLAILKKNNMIVNNLAAKAPKTITDHDKREINRILTYFEEKHSLKDVKYVSKDFKLGDMENVFGFKYEGYIYLSKDNYFSYNMEKTNLPMDIKNYDYLLDFRNKGTDWSVSNKDIKAKYDNQNGLITLYLKDKEVYRKSIKDFADTLYNKYGTKPGESVNVEDMIFEDENTNVRVKFIFYNIYGSKDFSTNGIEMNGSDFYILLKIK